MFFVMIGYGFSSIQSQDYNYRTFTDLREALQYSAEYSVEDVRILDLSQQNLTTLPQEIWQLKNLQELNLEGNWTSPEKTDLAMQNF